MGTHQIGRKKGEQRDQGLQRGEDQRGDAILSLDHVAGKFWSRSLLNAEAAGENWGGGNLLFQFGMTKSRTRRAFTNHHGNRRLRMRHPSRGVNRWPPWASSMDAPAIQNLISSTIYA